MLWALEGDMDYYAKTLGLPRWSLSQHCCALCKCEKNGPMTWQDARLGAPWVKSCWKPAEWMQSLERSMNRLFSLPGVTCATVALDYMHCKYLGSDQYFLLC